MESIFGLFLLLIIAGVTWCVSAEGAWSAVLTFLSVLFAGLLAMNFFEPLARFLENSLTFMQDYADLAALLGLFALFTFLLRLATENISPTDLELDGRLYQVVRWVFGLGTGYVTMAVLLTSVHTAPLPREFLGFRPEAANFFDTVAPDRQWLGFTQYVSENVLTTGRIFDGPKVAMPEDAEKRVWPSFPIRYATRRMDLASGRKPASTGGTGTVAPGPAGPPGGSAQPVGF